MADQETNVMSNVASVVPQLFYDVIARIIPGTVLILLNAISIMGPNSFTKTVKTVMFGPPEQRMSPILLVMLGCVFSYSISILLWRQISIAGRNRKFFNTIERKRSFMYDFIKYKDPIAGSRITKLSAEIHMTEVFSVGLIYSSLIASAILWTHYLSTGFSADDNVRVWIAVASLIGFSGSILSRHYFRDRAEFAVTNYYELLDGKDKLKDRTPIIEYDEEEENKQPEHISAPRPI